MFKVGDKVRANQDYWLIIRRGKLSHSEKAFVESEDFERVFEVKRISNDALIKYPIILNKKVLEIGDAFKVEELELVEEE